MTDVNGLSSLHEYTLAFIAAMPPMLPSQTMTSSSLVRSGRMVSSSRDVVGSYCSSDVDPALRGSWSAGKPRPVRCGGVCWGREVEAAVLRRETALRRQMDRQRHAEEQRWRHEHETAAARHAEEQRRRDCEWDGRLQKILQEHMKETFGLREEIEREQQLVARSETQLTETRAQLTQLHNQLEEMWRQKRESETAAREAETASLTEMHQKALERLQRFFEADKLQAKQWFTEEIQRVQSTHERLRADADDAYHQQIRRMEADITELQRRLRDSEAEVQQYKAKVAAAAVKPAVPSADETRIREEIRTLRAQLSDALDSKLRAERRATDAEREADERCKSLQVLQMELDSVIARNDVEQRSLREANQDLTDELTRTRTSHAEEIENLRRNARSSESVTSRETAKEFEETFRRMNERYDDMRRTLETEKTQLTKRLKEVERQHYETQRLLQQQTEQVEELRSEGKRQHERNAEKDRLITELRFSIEELKRTGGAVADLTARNHELQQETEKRRREHEAAVQAMNNNVQELRRERDAAQVRVAALVEELSAAQRAHSESDTRSKCLLDEAELRERQLRRETEEARQTMESWRERCTQLQTSAAAAAVTVSKPENLLREKENELTRLRGIVEAVKHDRDTLEQRLREERVTITKKEQESYEKQVTIDRLNMEVTTLHEKLQMATNYSQSGRDQPFTQQTEHSLVAPKSMEGFSSNKEYAPTETIRTASAPPQPSAGTTPSVPSPVPTQTRSPGLSGPSVSPAAPPQPSAGTTPSVPSPVPVPTQTRSPGLSGPSVSPAVPPQPSAGTTPSVPSPVPVPTQTRSPGLSGPSVSPAVPPQPSAGTTPSVPSPVPVPTQTRSPGLSGPSVSPAVPPQPSAGTTPSVPSPVPVPTQTRSPGLSGPSVSPAAPPQPSAGTTPSVPSPVPTQTRSPGLSGPSVSPAAPPQPSAGTTPSVPSPVPVPTQTRSPGLSGPSVSPAVPPQPSAGTTPSVPSPVPVPTQTRSPGLSGPSVSPAVPPQPSAGTTPSVPSPVPVPTQTRSPGLSGPSVSPAVPPQPSAGTTPSVSIQFPAQVPQSWLSTSLEPFPKPKVTVTSSAPSANLVTSIPVPVHDSNVVSTSLSRQESPPVAVPHPPSIPFSNSDQNQSYHYGSLVCGSNNPQSVVIPTPLVTAVPSSYSPGVCTVAATSTFSGISSIPTPVPVPLPEYNKEDFRSQMQTWNSVPSPVPVPVPVPVAFTTASTHSKEKKKKEHKGHRHREHKQK
ncbi:hypothetical protein LSM04_007312 [Trypanosoma melophagium]|uniref:uncharacterized protein n=1 Tax=Trypanosoma melophagium TaxID=715481 RepID=UPI00351A6181|nr:hypothetical protein LSM04_007312 [Trypanosoma melophagium]